VSVAFGTRLWPGLKSRCPRMPFLRTYAIISELETNQGLTTNRCAHVALSLLLLFPAFIEGV
jgi:hypothetical protein